MLVIKLQQSHTEIVIYIIVRNFNVQQSVETEKGVASVQTSVTYKTFSKCRVFIHIIQRLSVRYVCDTRRAPRGKVYLWSCFVM